MTSRIRPTTVFTLPRRFAPPSLPALRRRFMPPEAADATIQALEYAGR